MTCTSSVRQRGWVRFTKSGEGIEKTGINIHQGGIKLSMTDALTRSPGGETGRCCVEREIGLCPRASRDSRFLECPLATLRSSQLTWQPSSRNKRCSSNEFPSLRTCKSGGCCSFSAQPREQIIGSEQFHQSTPQSSGTARSECFAVPQQHFDRWTGCIRTHMRQRPCP